MGYTDWVKKNKTKEFPSQDIKSPFERWQEQNKEREERAKRESAKLAYSKSESEFPPQGMFPPQSNKSVYSFDGVFTSPLNLSKLLPPQGINQPQQKTSPNQSTEFSLQKISEFPSSEDIQSDSQTPIPAKNPDFLKNFENKQNIFPTQNNNISYYIQKAVNSLQTGIKNTVENFQTVQEANKSLTEQKNKNYYTDLLNSKIYFEEEAVKNSDFAKYAQQDKVNGKYTKNPAFADIEGLTKGSTDTNKVKSIVNKVEYAFDKKSVLDNRPEWQNPLGDVEQKYAFMTETERNTYNYYFNKFGNKKADEYLKLLDRELNQRQATATQERVANIANENKAAGIAVNIASNLASPISFGASAAQNIKNAFTGQYEPVDPYSNAMLPVMNVKSSQEGLTKDLQGVPKFLADVGLSMGQFISALPFGGTGALVILSGSAAGQASQDIAERGGSAEQALFGGLASGAIEYFTEKIPLDNLFKTAKQGIKPTKEMIKAVLKQGGIEGTEELISEYANTLADMAIMGSNSNFEQYKQTLISQGMSEKEAQKKAAGQFFIENPLTSFLGGALSGGVMGGGATTLNIVNSKISNKITGAEGQVKTSTADPSPKLTDTNSDGGRVFSPLANEQQERFTAETQPKTDMFHSAEDIFVSGQALGIDNKVLSKVNDISEKFGVQVQFEDARNINGRYKDGVIYINKNSKNPVMDIFKHELTHHLETSSEYIAFQSFIENNNASFNVMKGKDGNPVLWDDFTNEIKERYAREKIDLNEQELNHEITANFVEKFLFTNDTTIERLAQQDITLAQRIKQWISDMIVKFKGSPEEKFLLEAERKYINALQKVDTTQSKQNIGTAQYALESIDKKTGVRSYTSDFDKSVPISERIGEFKKKADIILNLSKPIQKTDVKGIKVLGDKFTVKKNIQGDLQSTKKEMNAKISSLYDLADIIETAKFQSKSPEISNTSNVQPKNKAHKDVKYWYKFTNDIIFDGTPYTVTINIRDKGKQQVAYLISFKEHSNSQFSVPDSENITENKNKTSKVNVSDVKHISPQAINLKPYSDLIISQKNKNFNGNIIQDKDGSKFSIPENEKFAADTDINSSTKNNTAKTKKAAKETPVKAKFPPQSSRSLSDMTNELRDTFSVTSLNRSEAATFKGILSVVADEIEKKSVLSPDTQKMLLQMLIETGKVTVSPNPEIQNYRKEIYKKSFYIPQNVKDELAYTHDKYINFRNKVFGAFNLTSKTTGIPIDTKYQELQEQYGKSLFPEVNHQAEMLETMFNVYEMGKPTEIGLMDYLENEAGEIGTDVFPTVAVMDSIINEYDEKLSKILDHYGVKAPLEKDLITEKNKRIKELTAHFKDKIKQEKAKIKQEMQDREERQELFDTVNRVQKIKTTPEHQKEIDALINAFNTRKQNGLQAFDIWEFTEKFKNREHTIKTEKKEVGTQRDIESAVSADRVKTEMAASKKPTTELMFNVLNPKNVFKRISGFKGSELLNYYTQLEDGQKKELTFKMQMNKKFQPFIDGNKKIFDKWNGKNAEFIDTGIEQNGKSLEITPAMRIMLYLHSLNDTNTQHIINGGLKVPDKNLYKKGRYSDAYAQGETFRLSKEQIDKITSPMTQQEKNFADIAYKVFNNDFRNAINETSLILDGYEKARVKNYAPISIDNDFDTNLEQNSLIRNGTVEGIGLLKQREKNSLPIRLEDITSTVLRQIEQVSKYYGMAIPIRNFNNMHNSTTDGGNNVKTEIRKKFGNTATNYINKLMTDLQFPNRNSDFMDKLRGNFAQAVLSVNPRVALQQPTSYLMASAYLDWNSLLKGLNPAKKVNKELISKYSATYWYRSQGNATQELADVTKNQAEWQKKIPFLMNWIQSADEWTLRRLWVASEAETAKKNPRLKYGTDEFYKEVGKKYDETVYNSQSNNMTLQKAGYLRTTNKLYQAINMFQNQRSQNFNMIYESWSELQEAKKSYKADTSRANEKKLQETGTRFTNTITGLVGSAAHKFISRVFSFKHGRIRGRGKKGSYRKIAYERLL